MNRFEGVANVSEMAENVSNFVDSFFLLLNESYEGP